MLLKRVVLLSLLITSLVGCAAQRVALKPDTFEDRKNVVGVAIVQPPEAGIAQYGGWLAFFNPMTNPRSREKKMLDFLKTADLSSFDAVADEFVKRLKAQKIKAKRIEDYVDLNEYRAVGNSYDFSKLARGEKLDSIILLSISSFGTWNYYALAYPMGSPRVFVQPMGYMVNFKENGTTLVLGSESRDKKWLLSRNYMQDYSAVPDWDQPPRYTNMNDVLKKLIDKAAKMLIDNFFIQQQAAK